MAQLVFLLLREVKIMVSVTFSLSVRVRVPWQMGIDPASGKLLLQRADESADESADQSVTVTTCRPTRLSGTFLDPHRPLQAWVRRP